MKERLWYNAGTLHGAQDGGEKAEYSVGELLGLARCPSVHSPGPLGRAAADERDERVVR